MSNQRLPWFTLFVITVSLTLVVFQMLLLAVVPMVVLSRLLLAFAFVAYSTYVSFAYHGRHSGWVGHSILRIAYAAIALLILNQTSLLAAAFLGYLMIQRLLAEPHRGRRYLLAGLSLTLSLGLAVTMIHFGAGVVVVLWTFLIGEVIAVWLVDSLMHPTDSEAPQDSFAWAMQRANAAFDRLSR